MSQIIYPITHLPPVIDIGKQTEKGVTRIGFDMHEWLDDWPGMKFSVQPVRPGEAESYNAATEQVGDILYWLVGAVDTEKAGAGTLEVLGVTEDERKLSAMCRTSIATTNTVSTSDIPEPNQPWVDQVILAGEGAKADAKDAATSATEAKRAQESAKASADAAAAAIPGASDPLKQLVTDADGKVAWEDRLAYKYTSTEKGYSYVYQDAEMASENGQYLLPTPPVAFPVAGETYAVIIGSNEYTSKCVDASVLTDGLEAYVFGNTAAMGDNLPIENPAPDATYIILLMPGGSDGFYGVLMSDDSVDSPVLTIRSAEEVETTTTNIKKVDRELLDIPTPDMNAGYDEEGYIANRPCWVYETEKGGIVWDGVIEGKEALYMTMNGTTQLLGYKVCPVPMDEHTFVNKLRSWSYAYPYNADGSSAGTKKIIDKREFVTYGLYAIRATGGNVLYYSYVAENTGDSLATFSGGGTGVYITPEFAATAPRIEWVTGYIYKPLDKKLLPPARTDKTATTTVYYWRWNPSSGEWAAVTIDQLKADLTCVVNVTVDSSNAVTACDKTYAQVAEAINAGKDVRAVVKNADGSMAVHLRLAVVAANSVAFNGTWAVGSGTDAVEAAYTLTMASDGTNTYEYRTF